MTGADILLGAAAFVATLIASTYAIRYRRLQADCRAQDRQMAALHRRADQTRDDREALLEELHELAPLIADGQRRWGCPLPPRTAAAVAGITPESSSRWLMRHAPGIDRLSQGEYATETFFAKPAPTGAWTPPRALVEPEQRKPRRRRVAAR